MNNIFQRALSIILLGTICSFSFGNEIKTLKVGKKPESVCKAFGGKLYVSIINGTEPGDGSIAVIEGDSVRTFTSGLDDPKGMAFIDHQIIVSDRTKIWSINAEGTAKVLVDKKDFPREITFLNDIEASPDGKHIYVTDMSKPTWMFDPKGDRKLWPKQSEHAIAPMTGCVYKVSLSGNVIPSAPPGNKLMPGPNGITATHYRGKDALIMADFFTGNIVAWDGKHFKVIADGFRGADGISIQNNVLYISSWTRGKVWAHDLMAQSTTEISSNFTAAADFYHDKANNLLVVPDSLEGTITFLPCPQISRPVTVRPVVQTAKWALKWWKPRHQQKLLERTSKQIDLVFLGDSITHGWEKHNIDEWNNIYLKQHALNLGAGGDRTEHVLWRIQNGALDKISPKALVLLIGTNNSNKGHQPEMTVLGIETILDEITWRLPDTKVILLALFPHGEKPHSQTRAPNDIVNTLLEGKTFPKNVQFLNINDVFLDDNQVLSKDIMPDGLHPNAKGYSLWYEAMKPHLEKILNP